MEATKIGNLSGAFSATPLVVFAAGVSPGPARKIANRLTLTKDHSDLGRASPKRATMDM
jgi:hypothetical protein